MKPINPAPGPGRNIFHRRLARFNPSEQPQIGCAFFLARHSGRTDTGEYPGPLGKNHTTGARIGAVVFEGNEVHAAQGAEPELRLFDLGMHGASPCRGTFISAGTFFLIGAVFGFASP